MLQKILLILAVVALIEFGLARLIQWLKPHRSTGVGGIALSHIAALVLCSVVILIATMPIGLNVALLAVSLCFLAHCACLLADLAIHGARQALGSPSAKRTAAARDQRRKGARASLLVLVLAGGFAAIGPGAVWAAEEPAPSVADAQARERLVTALAIYDLYLIDAGRLASREALTPAAKAEADQIVAEATASYQALKNPALAAGTPFPTSVDNQRRLWLEALEKAHGREFDRLFAQQKRSGASDALHLTEGYSKSGEGFYVKEYATRALPRLKRLLDAAAERGSQ